jgi:hypothetical protein
MNKRGRYEKNEAGRAFAGIKVDDEEERDPVHERLVGLLEKAPLYVPVAFPETAPAPRKGSTTLSSSAPSHPRDPGPADEFAFPDVIRIELPCPSCPGAATRTFEQDTGGNDTHVRVGEMFTPRFICTHCRSAATWFLIYVDRSPSDRHLSLVKAGQWPSDRPVPARELAKALGKPAAALYAKGLAVERFGYGIGAFAYYRRVAEDIIEGLMTGLRRYAEDNGATELVTKIDGVAGEQQASKRIDAIRDAVPRALRPAGMENPLGTIYAALSGPLHSGSDKECLKLAGHLRVALEFVVMVLAEQVDRTNRYKSALQDLQRAPQKQIESDAPDQPDEPPPA